MPILTICVFGKYDYPGSWGERYRTIMVFLFDIVASPVSVVIPHNTITYYREKKKRQLKAEEVSVLFPPYLINLF